MSGYAAGEALILTQVQAVAGFSADNTSRGNYRMLNSGKAAAYAILRPAEWEMTWIAATVAEFTWGTVVEVWQRYTDDGTSLTALEALEDLLIARLLAYRKLGDTTGSINDSNPRRGGETLEMWGRGGDGPSWLRRDITVEWVEHVTVVFAE